MSRRATVKGGAAPRLRKNPSAGTGGGGVGAPRVGCDRWGTSYLLVDQGDGTWAGTMASKSDDGALTFRLEADVAAEWMARASAQAEEASA